MKYGYVYYHENIQIYAILFCSTEIVEEEKEFLPFIHQMRKRW